MISQLSVLTVITRLLVSVLFAGIIGIDRAYKHRPAGLRTHILVCLGACIIAMIQQNIGFNAIEMARQYPEVKGVLRADDARLIAQVVSGIGFLGAGTIIVEHHSIRGLTTAASLWVVACIGLAVGMGDYIIAIAGFLVVYAVLGFLKKIIRISPVRKLKVEYLHKVETKNSSMIISKRMTSQLKVSVLASTSETMKRSIRMFIQLILERILTMSILSKDCQ